MKIYRICVVVPCYNEENRFPEIYWNNLISKHSDIFWLFVNDGSKDNTKLTLNDLVVNFENSKIISLKKNVGKGNAIREGFKYVFKELQYFQYVAYLDSDGAFNHHDLSRIFNSIDSLMVVNSHQFDMLIGSRVALAGQGISRNFSRHLISRVLITLITLGWHRAPYDTQSGFKIFNANMNLLNCFSTTFKTRWFFDIEIIIRLELLNQGTYKIREIPVFDWVDVKGSHITSLNFIRIAYESISIRRLVSREISKTWI